MSIMKRAMMPNPMNKGILYRQTGGSTNPYAPDYGVGFDPNAPRALIDMPTPVGPIGGGKGQFLDRPHRAPRTPGQGDSPPPPAPGPTPGAPTIPHLPGVEAEEGLNLEISGGVDPVTGETIAPAGPVIPPNATPEEIIEIVTQWHACLLYTSPSPRD